MKHFISLTLVMLLSVSVLLADPVEFEIQLIEVVGSTILGEEDPLGNPTQNGETPTRPTDFRATICGNVLTVTSANSNSTNLVVSNGSGNEVVNTQFVGFSTELLSTSGSYSIEIHTAGLTLIGQFVVQ